MVVEVEEGLMRFRAISRIDSVVDSGEIHR
jgi:hypothetical protein